MTDLEKQKEAAAKAAVTNIENGMVVGLGTGSTVSYAIKEIAGLVKNGLKITAVSTSKATERLASSLGIEVSSFDNFHSVDLTIDGADEIGPGLCAIKGGGGALLREKIVAAASKKVIIIVDSSKPVKQLGKFKLPLEVLPFGKLYVLESLKQLGGSGMIRLNKEGEPFLTDQGNMIIDADFKIIADPPELEKKIDHIPGILEHGLFIDVINLLYVGTPKGVDIIKKNENNEPSKTSISASS